MSRVVRAREPRVAVVAFVGIVCAVLGWSLVRATLGARPAGSMESAEQAPPDDQDPSERDEPAVDSTARGEAAARPDQADGDDGDDAPSAAADDAPRALPDPQTVAGGAGDGAEAAPPTSAATSAATPAPTSTELQRGRVAYVRCGATERCPRDLELEAAAWTLLERLPTCGRLAGQTGTADVRFHFEGDVPEVRFRDHGEDPLAIGALRACLEGPTAALRTSSSARPLTVSFRLELRAP